jgi:hypothetical protein
MVGKILIYTCFLHSMLINITHATVLNVSELHIDIYVPHMVIVDRFDVVQDQYGTGIINSFSDFVLTHAESYLDIYLSLRTNVLLDAIIEYKGVFHDDERVMFKGYDPFVFNPNSKYSNVTNPIYLIQIGDGTYSSEGDIHSMLNNILIKQHSLSGGVASWNMDETPVIRFEINITGGE